ncbi:MAG: hypothetical protein A2527_05360 [Candidatus Lambdaproteobacteria bacterium RIFOXYD2_FULL_50_16]|uniref:DNA-directed RNA polymerase subunit omega n=1 Tax=Candidatus Lambdaproteobacteria bacterium RIFOXYD2_FULL_50_16 TaxID=1817772 RepID=A0A1F6G913_9PROT|nr:MAG: hypothetical protein A2527_05360 [Candidatus Lambdaproteobacteria bacterium RIFOXYD2_FULL_50_16]
MKKNYLDLIEEYKFETPLSQFEKVLVLSSRAKDIYSGKSCMVSGLEGRKPTTKAQYEMLTDLIEPVITDKIETPEDYDFDEEEDEG